MLPTQSGPELLIGRPRSTPSGCSLVAPQGLPRMPVTGPLLERSLGHCSLGYRFRPHFDFGTTP